jgi:DtxR family Mn-dependent transcriptional regulator
MQRDRAVGNDRAPGPRNVPFPVAGAVAVPSLTVENYVKAIYQISSAQRGEPASTGQIAASLGVLPGTVTSMLKTLDAARLATHKPYEGVSLTRSGRMLALRMIRRHRLIELFLLKTLDMTWDAFLDHPEVDPHGDPIPRGESMSMQSAEDLAGRPLADVAEGGRFRLTRVLDQSPEFLRYLTDSGLALGTEGQVERNPEGAGLMRIRVARQSLSVALEAAGRIIVTDA